MNIKITHFFSARLMAMPSNEGSHLSAVGQCWTVPLLISKKDAMNTKLLVVWNAAQTSTSHLHHQTIRNPSLRAHRRSVHEVMCTVRPQRSQCVRWFQMVSDGRWSTMRATRVSL